MNRVEYRSYLQSPTWRFLRLEKLKQSEFRCQSCETTKCLDVHHETYARVGGGERMSDLIVLCRDCHNACHGKPTQRLRQLVLDLPQPTSVHDVTIAKLESELQKLRGQLQFAMQADPHLQALLNN